jgi:hypothetical protein
VSTPLTPEPLDAKALAAIIGYKPEKGKVVVLHGDRTFWLHDGLWYDYEQAGESPDDSS